MPTRSRGSAPFDLIRLLDGLSAVDFIVVGGVAGTLHGSPRLTLDLDIVPDGSDRNVHRMETALTELNAVVRDPGGRTIPVTSDLLRETARATPGGQLRLRTSAGPVDLLWRLHDGRGFAELLPQSVLVSDGERTLRVVTLDALIDIKRAADRPRDREDVAYLTRIRDRLREPS